MITCAAVAMVCLPVLPATLSAPPDEPCVASFYGEAHRGLTTASGVPFDPDAFTAASWGHDFGTVLEVSHGGETVEVEVTDRGPARRLDRCLDLSAAAYGELAPPSTGLVDVTYEVVE